MLTLGNLRFELLIAYHEFFLLFSSVMICGWLNLLMWNCGFEGPTVKFCAAFQLHRVYACNPCLVQGLLCSSRMTTEVLADTSLRSRNYCFVYSENI